MHTHGCCVWVCAGHKCSCALCCVRVRVFFVENACPIPSTLVLLAIAVSTCQACLQAAKTDYALCQACWCVVSSALRRSPVSDLGPVLSVLWLRFSAVLVAEVVLVAEAVLHAWGMMHLSLEPNNEEEEVIIGAVRSCNTIYEGCEHVRSKGGPQDSRPSSHHIYVHHCSSVCSLQPL